MMETMAFSQSVEKHSDDCTVEECRALVQRIEGSNTFQKSPRLREFLLFVCERYLEGDRDSLREQSIGQAVFRKPVGYDPVADNVVRVQARQLRLKLEQYFVHERLD